MLKTVYFDAHHRHKWQCFRIRLVDKLEVSEASDGEHLPFVKLIKNGEDTGVAFHGVPGGHEFTSFILGLYNTAGPGQQLEDDEVNGSKSLTKDYDLKILVSLSCTMCPDLVVAAQHLAAINPHVKAHVYDLNLYHDLKDKYKVMSVPCTVTNDDNVSFGRKSFTELVEHLQKI